MFRALMAGLVAGVLLIGFPVTAQQAGGQMGGEGGHPPGLEGGPLDLTTAYSAGVEALRTKNYRDAARYFDAVLDGAPLNAQTWRMLGLAKAGGGDLKGARRAYERAVKLAPENVAGRQGLALALAGLKDAKA